MGGVIFLTQSGGDVGVYLSHFETLIVQFRVEM